MDRLMLLKTLPSLAVGKNILPINNVIHTKKTLMDLFIFIIFTKYKNTYSDPDETRTRNLLIRSQTPYPLGHRASGGMREVHAR